MLSVSSVAVRSVWNRCPNPSSAFKPLRVRMSTELWHDGLMFAYVGVTDGDWYRYLAERGLDEVNFWRPSGDRVFRAVPVGSPFFFKTHSPHNRVVGGGFYSGFASLTISEAWRLYGEANGAASLNTMRLRVGKYRRHSMNEVDDPQIGCVFVRDVVFFGEDEQAKAPPDFAPSIVQGKSYDTQASGLETYFSGLLARILSPHFDGGLTSLGPGRALSMGTLG